LSTEAAVGLAVGLLSIGAALASLAVAWGRQGARMAQLEKETGKIDALQKEITAIDTRQRDSAKSQGERLEDATVKLAVLMGKFESFDSGFAAGRRSKTAAHGNAIPGKGP
jgi:hypothetical protein